MALPFSPYLETETEATISTVEPRGEQLMVRRQASVCFSVGFVTVGSTEKEKSLNVCCVLRASGDAAATYGFPGPLAHLAQLCPRAEGAVKHSVPEDYLRASRRVLKPAAKHGPWYPVLLVESL